MSEEGDLDAAVSGDMTDAEYMQHRGWRCPYCRAPGTHAVVDKAWLSFGADWWLIPHSCAACGKKWDERAQIVGWEARDDA